jgi:hypothetical protein
MAVERLQAPRALESIWLWLPCTNYTACNDQLQARQALQEFCSSECLACAAIDQDVSRGRSMNSNAYTQGIRKAYVGEIVGERLYRALGLECEHPQNRIKFLAIAAVEALTNQRLRPIATRLGIMPDEAEMRMTIERRASELRQLSWREFIRKAASDWPPYIAEFEALAEAAAPGDASILQDLIAHERALVQFVAIEAAGLAEGTSQNSLAPLHDYLSAQR